MQNAGLDEAQAGIKIARRNINNLRNADDDTLMAGTKEPLDEGEKRRVKKLAWNSILKKLRLWQLVVTLHDKLKKMEAMIDFIFLGSKITSYGDCSHEIKRHLLFGRKAMTNLDSILKSRHITLGNEGLYSQSYGFSSSHVWT